MEASIQFEKTAMAQRKALCHRMATRNGLEPSTSSVTGWRSNQLNYRAINFAWANLTYIQAAYMHTGNLHACRCFSHLRDIISYQIVVCKCFFKKFAPFLQKNFSSCSGVIPKAASCRSKSGKSRMPERYIVQPSKSLPKAI